MDVDKLRALIQQDSTNTKQQPVVMVNLLQFKQPDGRAKYHDYSRAMLPILQRHGATVVYSGDVRSLLIASSPVADEGSWDMVLLVRYPSAKAFGEMVVSKEYKEVSKLRSTALSKAALIASHEVVPKRKSKL